MNTKLATILGITSLATCTLMSGPVVVVQTPSIVVAPAPAPVVVVDTGVPDSYVWDGNEYVGVIGDQYYYLGPNQVWLKLDASRQARFHDWERAHADWRTHAISNEKYRRDMHGHIVPFRNPHATPAVHAAPGHDAGDHHDH